MCIFVINQPQYILQQFNTFYKNGDIMRIAVIGAGAMGSIYGGHLSQHNEVILVDTNQQVVEQINKNGLLVD